MLYAGIFLEQRDLIRSSVFFLRVVGDSQGITNFLGKLFQFPLQGSIYKEFHLFLAFQVHCLCFLFDFRELLSIFVCEKGDCPTSRLLPVFWVQSGLKDCPEAVIVPLRDRVVPVVVALGASDGHSKEGRGNDLQGFGNYLVSSEFVVGS